MTHKGLVLSLTMAMTMSHTYGQSLFNARAAAVGAYAPFVSDTRGFTDNPAGIVGIRDWEFTTSTYAAKSNTGFVFQGLTFGKKILDDGAVALQYSPGSLLQFVVPSGVSINTGDSVISLDKRISYSEDFSFALAYKLRDEFSVGLGARVRREKITDTQYRLVPAVQLTSTDYSSGTVLGDLSAFWRPASSVSCVATVRNLLAIRDAALPDELTQFMLPEDRILELGVRYLPVQQLALAGMGSTKGYGAFGSEVTLPDLHLALRGSLFLNKAESPLAYAYGVGAGWAYEFFEIGLAYLGFVDQTRHAGSSSVTSFDASGLDKLDLNAYTKNRLVLSVKAIFGKVREGLVRIEGVNILSGVYPSSYELYAFRPLGSVRIRNVSGKPVQAKASFFIDRFMDAPTETPAVSLMPGEEKDVPFNAVLNDRMRTVNQLTVREAEVFVHASSSDQYDDRIQTKVLIHGRNDWDGDAGSLRHFVTPDDPEILRYTRDVLLQYKDSLSAAPRELEPFVKARLLFNTFAGKLVYVGDPKQSSDYVQYPAETLSMRSGDCDDMTACFSSLLSSVGISTAFVDVVPPEDPSNSHIYMMFDTGLDPKFGPNITGNPKRYVVRRNSRGEETIWIPIETTVITKGFEEAWSTGAQEYLDDVEIHLGLVKGWVRIIDVN